ncbi:MAG: TetR/AcrR family transcriptional regulator [Pseudomonadota bacterium]
MKAPERRAQVLAVARDVFAERGYHAARIDDIVERARIARGTFYLYFEDKRAVFSELLDDLTRRLRQAVRRVDLASAESPEQQLRENVRRVLVILLEERALTKILISDAVGLDPGFDEKLHAFYDHIAVIIEGSLAEGERLGLVRPQHRQIAACAVIGSIKELCYRSIFGRLYISVDEALDALFELHGRALLAGPLASALDPPGPLA